MFSSSAIMADDGYYFTRNVILSSISPILQADPKRYRENGECKTSFYESVQQSLLDSDCDEVRDEAYDEVQFHHRRRTSSWMIRWTSSLMTQADVFAVGICGTQ